MHAYDRYLRGLLLRNGLTGDALRQAAVYFDSAAALDPDFAYAYAGRATVIGPLITFGHVPGEEGLAEFHALTRRALELDPTLGEAHVALGLLRLFFVWDFEGAGASLRRALELNPSDPHAHHHYANWLRLMGRLDDAIAAGRRAVEFDPLNARTYLLLGSDLLVAGDPEGALPELERAVALDPVHALALGQGPWLPATPGEALRMLGRYREAVEDYVRIAGLRGASASEIYALRRGFETDGMPGFWRSWIAMDTRQSGRRPDPLRCSRRKARRCSSGPTDHSKAITGVGAASTWPTRRRVPPPANPPWPRPSAPG
jgi:tetratricopeptide (TPR) repeat protein